jgi:hypothetical protein
VDIIYGVKGKICRKCEREYPATTEHFYSYAPKRDHPHGGLQPYCRDCWKVINHDNKMKLKEKKYGKLADREKVG